MTEEHKDDPRRQPFVNELRRLADLVESGAVPVPHGMSGLSWFVHGPMGEQPAKAAAIAAALGGTWSTPRRATSHVITSCSRPTLRTELDIYIDWKSPEDRERADPRSEELRQALDAALGSTDAR